jgi:hypothetical protein
MLYDWLEFVLWLNITSLKRLKFLFKKIKKMYEYQTTNTRDQHKKIAHTFKTWLEKEKIGKKLKWKTIKNQLIIGVDSPTGKECFLPYSSSLANLLTTLENTMVSIFLDKKSTSSQSPIEHRWVMTSASSGRHHNDNNTSEEINTGDDGQNNEPKPEESVNFFINYIQGENAKCVMSLNCTCISKGKLWLQSLRNRIHCNIAIETDEKRKAR